MTRENLLRTEEYWIGEIQHELYKIIEDYLKHNDLNRIQFAEMLGVTKGYVSQILNGEFDHRLSKLVELAMKVGKIPKIDFFDIEEILQLDQLGELHNKIYKSININLTIGDNFGISMPSDNNDKTLIDTTKNTKLIKFENSIYEKENISV
jgi:transcriptional regulator with XRE-family HTH domain